ncbi:hypothetical protein DFQ30_004139 [Apophysomyces sp. BC1015]|nr:hypothetical protein DFQ30_004139 [Apophysomyces sp. BC1015]
MLPNSRIVRPPSPNYDQYQHSPSQQARQNTFISRFIPPPPQQQQPELTPSPSPPSTPSSSSSSSMGAHTLPPIGQKVKRKPLVTENGTIFTNPPPASIDYDLRRTHTEFSIAEEKKARQSG